MDDSATPPQPPVPPDDITQPFVPTPEDGPVHASEVAVPREPEPPSPKKRRRMIAFVITLLVLVAAVAGIAVAVVMAGGGAGGPVTQPVDIGAVLKPGWKPTPPAAFYAPLSGIVMPPGAYLRRPIAVKVENEPPARPQSGLDRADVIYEVPMEGYDVTRYIAIFQSRTADVIGPVRSARFADVEVIPEYKALFAHCGGVWQVLEEVKKAHIVDLDQYFNEESYWRAGFRSAPHNLYTSTARLWELARRKKAYKPTRLPSFGFKDEKKRASDPVRTIEINYGDVTHVRWEYSRRSNSYRRFQQGEPHTDKETGRQLAARNLIIMHADETVTNIEEDVQGSKSLKFGLIGEGQATIFVDGKRVNGRWIASPVSPPYFTDKAGNRVLLNRGNVWIEIVPPRIKPVITK